MEKLGDILKNMKSPKAIQNVVVETELQKDTNYRLSNGVSKTRRAFVKAFSALDDELLNLTGNEIKVLLHLAFEMEYTKSRLTMDYDFWEELTAHFQTTRDYLRRVLSSLKAKGFIYDDRTYLYISSKYLTKRRS